MKVALGDGWRGVPGRRFQPGHAPPDTGRTKALCQNRQATGLRFWEKNILGLAILTRGVAQALERQRLKPVREDSGNLAGILEDDDSPHII